MIDFAYLTPYLIPFCGWLVGCCMVLCVALLITMFYCAKENNDDWNN